MLSIRCFWFRYPLDLFAMIWSIGDFLGSLNAELSSEFSLQTFLFPLAKIALALASLVGVSTG